MGSIVQNIDFGNRVTVHSGNSFWKEVLNMNSEFFHNWKWAFFPYGASCLCRWMAGNSHLPRIFIYRRFQSLSAVFSLKVGFAGRTEREDKKKRPKKTKLFEQFSYAFFIKMVIFRPTLWSLYILLLTLGVQDIDALIK